MAQLDKHSLRVEGKDDMHVIRNLLQRHGINGSIVEISDSGPADQGAGGVDSLLAGMGVAVKASNGRSVGFVLDADHAPNERWEAVRQRLFNVGLEPPVEIPEDGFVGDSAEFQARVGVWLMPDNQRSGALEDFLKDLIDREDRLIQLATTSTKSAREHGAAFSDAHQGKAVLHTWLAWQENPGLPYGVAITAKYFRRKSAAEVQFIAWFRRVFQLMEE